jgi:hypothetical protein
MAATAGTIFAIGLATKQGYAIDAYVPDAAGGVWTFDDGAGAGSGSTAWYSFPEDVVITDISMAGAPTATKGRITSNGLPSGNIVRFGSHLYSLNSRPVLNIKIQGGKRLGIVNMT